MVSLNDCSFLHLFFDVCTLWFGVLVADFRDLLHAFFRDFIRDAWSVARSFAIGRYSILLLSAVGVFCVCRNDDLMTFPISLRWSNLMHRHLYKPTTRNLRSHGFLVRILWFYLLIVILDDRVSFPSVILIETCLHSNINEPSIVHQVLDRVSGHQMSGMQNVARRTPRVLANTPHVRLIHARLRPDLLGFRLVAGRALAPMARNKGIHRRSLKSYSRNSDGRIKLSDRWVS